MAAIEYPFRPLPFGGGRNDPGSFGGFTGSGPETVLADGSGQVFAPPGTASRSGWSFGSSSGSSVIFAPSTASTSPFVINVIYDASVANAPSGFTAGVAAAVLYLESQYTDPVTININVGYGEVGGYSLGNGALGSSLTYLSNYSYSQITGALTADATTTNDTAAIASLPTSSPLANANYWVSTAEAKALGLAGASSAVDGYVGFSSTYAFDYNSSDGITTGTYDFFGTVVHEITEAMGRMLLTGSSLGGLPNSYEAYDLFHYSSSGTRDFSASTPGYFSINSGATNLANFNTVSGGDAGDWGSGMGNDAFNAFSNSGVVNAVSNADLIVLDAIGWDLAGATSTPPPTPTGPTGVSLTAATYKTTTETGTGLAANAPIATVSQSGGSTSDSYIYALGGANAASFSLTSAGNIGSLAVGGTGLSGALNGRAYNLTLTAQDTTLGLSSPASPLGVVVGSSTADMIDVATLLGSTSTPAFIYGLGGNDTINASSMTSRLWLAGGAGADVMTGGSGVDTYAYGATADSTPSLMDVITNFNPAMDLIDLTGLGVGLSYIGRVGGSIQLPAHSIAYQLSGGNTFIYVNTSGGSERLGGADMKIELQGRMSLRSSDFLHA